ncbi:hypothetical protein GC163_00470 [bacterium]|nr:hypothetical protein [bacterium]
MTVSPPPIDPADLAESPVAATDDRAALLRQFETFERNFRRDHFALWFSTLIGPWLLTLLAIAAVYLVQGPKYTRFLLGMALVSFTFAGRFVIPLQDAAAIGPLTSHDLFWMVTFQDVVVALFMAFHVGFLFKLPWIGPKFLELTADGEMILSLQPWMRRLTFGGLIAFIAFPLAATGSVGGAIFGRLLGLSRWATFWGSVIGAAIGNAAMLYGSQIVLHYLPEDSWAVRLGGPLVVLAIIVLLERRYSSMKRQFLKDRDQPPTVSTPPEALV